MIFRFVLFRLDKQVRINLYSHMAALENRTPSLGPKVCNSLGFCYIVKSGVSAKTSNIVSVIIHAMHCYPD